MHLDFLDGTLRRLAVEEGFLPAGWAEAEICHFRLVAQCAQAAKVEGDLHATRILRLQACHDGEPGTWSVQLSARRRLAIAFKTEGTSATAVFSVSPPEVVSKETEEPR
jgi:plasmid maintenance system killer protein